ncbi:MAG: YbjN domain-containing protein [Armatimonadetes bacterium]|jgi:hypothetical protein|nr:YbjN domain-containing protein [Armatimonadota bacterium]
MRPPAAHDRLAATLAREHGACQPRQYPRRVLTPEERLALREQSIRAINEGMACLGMGDPAALQDENGFFHFPCGSIQCTLGLIAVEERDLLLVYAPIMDLPSDRDLILPLYRLLLELNNRFELSIAKFGLHGDTVFLSAMRPLEGLDPAEVEDIVCWVSRLADEVDERLLSEFGGTSRQRGGPQRSG